MVFSFGGKCYFPLTVLIPWKPQSSLDSPDNETWKMYLEPLNVLPYKLILQGTLPFK